MSVVRTLLKNTAYVTAVRVASPFVSMALVVYASRMLGPSGFGIYAAALTFVLFFEELASLGIQHVITRDVAVAPRKLGAYLNAAAVLAVAASSGTLVLLYLALYAIDYPPETASAVRWLSLSLLFTVALVYLEAAFQGLQRFDVAAAMRFTEVVLKVALGVAAIHQGYGVLGLIGAVVVSRAVATAVGSWWVFRVGHRFSWEIDATTLKQLVRLSGTFVLIGLVTNAYWKIDVIMLSKMQRASDVGLYTAAYRLMEILKTLSFAYVTALFPVLSRSFEQGRESLEKTCTLSIKYLNILSAPIVIGTFVLSSRIVHLIYGSEFAVAGDVLRILVWTVAIFPPAFVMARALVASHHQRADLVANVIAMAVNVSLNVYLIPRWSHRGAAVATIVSVTALLIVQYRFASRRLFEVDLVKSSVKPLAAALVMGTFTSYVIALPLPVVVAGSALVYGATLFALGAISPEEIDFLRSFLTGSKSMQRGPGAT